MPSDTKRGRPAAVEDDADIDAALDAALGLPSKAPEPAAAIQGWLDSVDDLMLSLIPAKATKFRSRIGDAGSPWIGSPLRSLGCVIELLF